jgi:hypothetical protein
MCGTEITKKYFLNCKKSRLQEIEAMLEDDKNDFIIRGEREKFLMLDNKTICGLTKKSIHKKVDWNNLRFEHSRTLTNGRGDKLIVKYAKVRLHGAHKDNPTGYNTTVLVFETENISFETEKSSSYEDGSKVSHFLAKNKYLYVSDGDKERLGTYPIIIYVDEKKSKKDRFMMRYI